MYALYCDNVSQTNNKYNATQKGFATPQAPSMDLPLCGVRGGGVLPIMAYTGRLCPKGVLFSGFRHIKG